MSGPLPKLLTSLVLVVLVGCGGSALRWTPEYHEVREGETLYSIAFRHGLDHRQLAAWNRLGDGSLIYPGQRIRLSPPAGAVASAPPSRPSSARRPPAGTPSPSPPSRAPEQRVNGWQWPAAGPVIGAYGSSPKTESGIQIGGRMGQPVLAAAAGEVVYSGSGLVGYGQLLIIKHNETFLSAYGHNSTLLVQEGQRVSAGQRIARMGQGPGQRPMLHFEIRRNGQPENPVGHLPRR